VIPLLKAVLSPANSFAAKAESSNSFLLETLILSLEAGLIFGVVGMLADCCKADFLVDLDNVRIEIYDKFMSTSFEVNS
jgi:hypothetical protein